MHITFSKYSRLYKTKKELIFLINMSKQQDIYVPEIYIYIYILLIMYFKEIKVKVSDFISYEKSKRYLD